MEYLILALIAAAAGYGCFILAMMILPKRLKADSRRQYLDIINDARTQAEVRKLSERERLEEEAQMRLEQLDADISERNEDLKIAEEDLNNQERSLQIEETRLQKAEKETATLQARVEAIRAQYEQKHAEIETVRRAAVTELEAKTSLSSAELNRSLQENMVESRRIECQKTLRFLEEELGSNSKRLAQRLMDRSLARYTPEFYWPKSINSIELEEQKLAERVASEGESMLIQIRELAGIEAELITGPDVYMPFIKLAGGAGIDREAARLTLAEVLPKGQNAWQKLQQSYERHRAALEAQAVSLGRQAIREVGLPGIHPEIQKLVGYLNWRTSYRQNQWYHTVEVAKLAGIIANEVGVDPDAAKRVGLLHDIGKALDYRIDGSHAVISGDYADRFGEKRLICDTVMSHHNDLVLETPLSFVLKAADTLSGARPGARVNLEEGYQMRLSGIEAAVRSFPGIVNIAIMNGAREVHVEVNHKRIQESDLQSLSQNIARKIEADVAFPGEIKILVTRRFEATAVA